MARYFATLKQHNLYPTYTKGKLWGGCAYPQPPKPKKEEESEGGEKSPEPSQKSYRMKKTKVRDKCHMLFNTKAGQNFIAFYSVSFPRGISDDDAFRVWNYWLTYLRKEQRLKSYLWVTERQKNGTIHYHMLTCDFMPIRKTNDALRTILQNYNTKYNRGWQNVDNYNGVDVFSVWAKDGKSTSRGFDRVDKKQGACRISEYITKYVSKNNDTFSHLCWHCSRCVSALATSKHCTWEEWRFWKGYVDEPTNGAQKMEGGNWVGWFLGWAFDALYPSGIYQRNEKVFQALRKGRPKPAECYT